MKKIKRVLALLLCMILAVPVVNVQAEEQQEVDKLEQQEEDEVDTGLKVSSNNGDGDEFDNSRYVTIPYGEGVTLRVLAEGGAGELSYQWYRGWGFEESIIAGADKASYYLTGDADTQWCYRCEVTDGVVSESIEFYITVDTGLKVGSDTGVNEYGGDEDDEDVSSTSRRVVVTYGEGITLNVTAEGGAGLLSYQWYEAGYAYEDSLIPGAEEDSYYLTGSADTGENYYCEVTDGVVSMGVRFLVIVDTDMNVSSSTGVDEDGGSISSTSRYVTIAYGERTALRVTAEGGVGELSYQWYESGYAEEGAEISGATADSYYLEGDNSAAEYYYCEVTDEISSRGVTFYITVDTGLRVSSNTGVDADGDSISSAFRDVTLEYGGGGATLKVTAGGGLGKLSYQWYEGSSAYEDNAIPGATADSYRIPGDGSAESSYYCEVTDGVARKGVTFYIIMDTGLRVSSNTGVGSGDEDTSSDSRIVTIKYGEGISLKVTAEGGAGELSYEWYKGDYVDQEAIAGASKNSYYIVGDDSTEYRYYCEVTDGVAYKYVEFWIRVETGLQAEGISGEGYGEYPLNNRFLKASKGQTVQLKVNAASDIASQQKPLTYRWYTDTGSEWGEEISGADTADCSVKAEKSGLYWCVVSDGINTEYLNFTVLVDVDFQWNAPANTLTIHGTGVIPAGILDISGCSEQSPESLTIIIEDGITEIADWALCTERLSDEQPVSHDVTIPASVKEIGSRAVGSWLWFEEEEEYVCDNSFCTIRGYADTEAQRYADENNIHFIPLSKTNMTDCSITFNAAGIVYTGGQIRPQVTVKDKEKTLAEGTDYTVEYENNINAGTAAVLVIGKGDYTGTKRAAFTIEACPLSASDITLSAGSFPYSSKEQKPGVTVKAMGRTLVEGVDYTVGYSNNINIGTAAVLVSGKGNYTGTVQKSFAIVADKDSVHISGANKYKIMGAEEAAFIAPKNSKAASVKIPASVVIGGKEYKVTSIADKAFRKTSVKTVNIGDNVRKIGKSAFEGCSSLTKVTIGKGVTDIGSSAFKGCKKLGSVTVKSLKLKSVGKKAFEGIKSSAKIKVPSSRLKKYQKLFKGKGQGKKVKITK